tara:strand:- start:52 stop:447 length:396 start_codon:yes stop_codon:yes gene_type:complete
MSDDEEITEQFNKLLEYSKEAEAQGKEKALREGAEAIQLISISNNPRLYFETVRSIVYQEFPKNDDIINKQYEQEVIDNIKMHGKTINDAGGIEMMGICFKFITALMHDKNRKAHQCFLDMCWDGVGEWLR